jgi:hypothetical protein
LLKSNNPGTPFVAAKKVAESKTRLALIEFVAGVDTADCANESNVVQLNTPALLLIVTSCRAGTMYPELVVAIDAVEIWIVALLVGALTLM